MSDERIRLRFSGLVIFFAQMASILTGLIFIYIITHNLTIVEYGAWTSIGQLATTLTVASGIFPFWSARYAARKFPGAMKLGLLANLGLYIPALIIALVVAPTFAEGSQTSAFNYVYAGLLMVEAYVIGALVPVVAIKKPQVMGYALIVYEVLKVLTVIPLVVVLRLGVFGALTVVGIASLAQGLLYAFMLRGIWFEKVNFRYLSEWIKGSPFNVYLAGSIILGTMNLYVLLFASGASGPEAVAFYGIAVAITTPITYTGSLATALYAKLLAGGTSSDIETVWRLSLMFSIPLTLAVILLAPSFLQILGAAFVPASRAVIVLAVSTLIYTWGGIFDRVIVGTERLDLEGAISVRAVLGSSMSKVVTASYASVGVSLLLLWSLLIFRGSDSVTAVEFAALAVLVGQVSLALAKYLLARRGMSFRFPARSALKYLAVASTLLLVVPFLQQPMRALVTIPLFLSGAGLYLLLLYFLDDEAKDLIREVVSYLRIRI